MAENVALPPASSPPITGLGLAPLGCLLGALASQPGPVPKYRYPSAGTLYPVQAYLILRQPLEGLGAGTYYHDPDGHSLVPVSGAVPAAPDGSAPPALLALVAQTAAIAPIYGEHAGDFSLLEAGYMYQALCGAGSGLVLRDAGDPAGNQALRAACGLEDSHVPLVCLAIGENA
jgi:hypothetical protein